jgi:hypothetical protein
MSESPPSNVSNSQPATSTELASSKAEPPSFQEQVDETSLWAAVRASRAREFALEWLALGLALAVLHLLFVAAPRATLTFLDAIVVLMTAGGGVVMYFFESQRGSALRALSKELLAHGAGLKSGNEVDVQSGDRVDGKKP